MPEKSEVLRKIEQVVERSTGMTAQEVRDSLFSDETDAKWHRAFRERRVYYSGNCYRIRTQ